MWLIFVVYLLFFGVPTAMLVYRAYGDTVLWISGAAYWLITIALAAWSWISLEKRR